MNRNVRLDGAGDANNDGFVDPDELGITGGITGKGQAPTFHERISLLRHRLDARETQKVAEADSSARTDTRFQSSDLIDENTAIKIGKISGADIIVLGSINRVGGIFYLNIKLIDVQTAEIIGSNIAQAKDASEFLDMCNQAVYMLF